MYSEDAETTAELLYLTHIQALIPKEYQTPFAKLGPFGRSIWLNKAKRDIAMRRKLSKTKVASTVAVTSQARKAAE